MYLFTQISFILLSLICLALITIGLKNAIAKVESDPSARKKKLNLFLIPLGIWIVFLGVMSYIGFFNDFSNFPPKMIIVLIIPLATILYVTFNKSFNEVLKAVPKQHILHLQSFRFFVEILLWMLFLDQLLPVQMTFEGRNFDVLVGITGPVFALLCFSNGKVKKTLGIIWNIAGLALLFNIVGIALLSMPTPFRVFMNEPSNTIVATFPIIFLPGILVPIAYSMHFFSLRQLLAKK